MRKKRLSTERGQQQKQKQYRPVHEDETHISRVADAGLAGNYSYSDYFRWKSEDRLELIRGKVFRMSPGSSLIHQRWCGFIYVKLYEYLSDKRCEVFIAPFDIRLPGVSVMDEDILTVVQPDICIVCDPAKLDERGCVGAPDVVIEILSEGNNWRELIDKFKVYEEAGVREYWIINPKRKLFFIYRLDEGYRFRSEGANRYNNGVLSSVFPDFKLNLGELLYTGL